VAATHLSHHNQPDPQNAAPMVMNRAYQIGEKLPNYLLLLRCVPLFDELDKLETEKMVGTL
jgi:hypothetical protein